jgi:hypothetical protein
MPPDTKSVTESRQSKGENLECMIADCNSWVEVGMKEGTKSLEETNNPGPIGAFINEPPEIPKRCTE